MKTKKYFQHQAAIIGRKAKIGEKTRIWAFANIQDGAIIGKSCNICDGCFVESGAVLGNHVTLKNGIAVFNGVTLEDDVFCGANAAFVNDRHPRSHRKDPWTLEKTIIQKGATIGSNATIMCGLTVGPYAIVGAGSVIIKNVPPHAIVIGNPAKFKGYACRCGKRLNNLLKCSCGFIYFMTKQGLEFHE